MVEAAKMLKYCNIFKNLKLVKLVFAVITAYLFLDEILIFLSMPTFTSETRTLLGPEHFPQIRLCPFPAFNQRELERQGYRTSYEFTLGTLRQSGALSLVQILEILCSHWWNHNILAPRSMP